jgi:hypothetical protein
MFFIVMIDLIVNFMKWLIIHGYDLFISIDLIENVKLKYQTLCENWLVPWAIAWESSERIEEFKSLWRRRFSSHFTTMFLISGILMIVSPLFFLNHLNCFVLTWRLCQGFFVNPVGNSNDRTFQILSDYAMEGLTFYMIFQKGGKDHSE